MVALLAAAGRELGRVSSVRRSAARREPRDVIGIEVGHDGRQVGRHDLEDRRPHEEPLEILGQVADDLLGEVVVQLLIGAAQAADELPDLRRRSVAEGGLDELERRGPAFGPRGDVGDDVRLEVAAVRLGEQPGGLGRVEAQVVRADLGDLAGGAQAGQRDRRRAAAGEHDRQALGCARDELAHDDAGRPATRRRGGSRRG